MKRSIGLMLLGGALGIAALPLHAQMTADEKPGVSVYDQHPECMKRDAASNANCVIDNGPPRRHVVGAVGAEAAAQAGAGAQPTPGTSSTNGTLPSPNGGSMFSSPSGTSVQKTGH